MSEVTRGPDGKPHLSDEDLRSLNPRQLALIEWMTDANRRFRTHNRIIFLLLLASTALLIIGWNP